MTRRQTDVSSVVHQNVKALSKFRHRELKNRTFHGRIVDRVAKVIGSFGFVYFNLFVIVSWLLLNSRAIPAIAPWDPYPFMLLQVSVSIEAIFLTTFILLNQRNMSSIAEKRADLDLQMSLLAEHEITHLVKMVDALAENLGARISQPGELDDIKTPVSPENVLRHMDEVEKGASNKN